MKKNTRSYVKLSIILYIVILSVALVSTLAWFVFKQSATIDTEESSKIVVGEYLEICLDDNDDTKDDEWTNHIGDSEILQFPDVSVMPDGTVWYPKTLDDSDGLLAGEANYIKMNGSAAGAYLKKIDIKVRASKALDVYLSDNSFVSGLLDAETDGDGKMNRDLIAGAARVAFFENGNANLVWVPNYKYELLADKSGVNMNGTPEEGYKYIQGVTGEITYGTWNEGKVLVGDNDTALAAANTIRESKPFLSFSEAGEKKISIYVWIEGTDRESNTVLSGGSIKYKLEFIGIETKSASTYDINGISIGEDGRLMKADGSEALSGEVLYSIDGKEWTAYTEGGSPLIRDSARVYIRANETAAQRLGEIRQIK